MNKIDSFFVSNMTIDPSFLRELSTKTACSMICKLIKGKHWRILRTFLEHRKPESQYVLRTAFYYILEKNRSEAFPILMEHGLVLSLRMIRRKRFYSSYFDDLLVMERRREMFGESLLNISREEANKLMTFSEPIHRIYFLELFPWIQDLVEPLKKTHVPIHMYVIRERLALLILKFIPEYRSDDEFIRDVISCDLFEVYKNFYTPEDIIESYRSRRFRYFMKSKINKDVIEKCPWLIHEILDMIKRDPGKTIEISYIYNICKSRGIPVDISVNNLLHSHLHWAYFTDLLDDEYKEFSKFLKDSGADANKIDWTIKDYDARRVFQAGSPFMEFGRNDKEFLDELVDDGYDINILKNIKYAYEHGHNLQRDRPLYGYYYDIWEFLFDKKIPLNEEWEEEFFSSYDCSKKRLNGFIIEYLDKWPEELCPYEYHRHLDLKHESCFEDRTILNIIKSRRRNYSGYHDVSFHFQ